MFFLVILITLIAPLIAEKYELNIGLVIPGIKLYSGFLSSQKQDHLYYIYVEKENAPLIIYFNGGPGCSSLIAFSKGVGPYFFTDKSKFIVNENGWHQHASLLFIDNPTGAGYSFSDSYTINSLESTKIVDEVLTQNFLNDFPDAFKNGVYPFGESFGARFALNLALEGMKMKQYIKGIGLVSPWISPVMQQSVFSQLAYNLGKINYEAMIRANVHGTLCNSYIRNGILDSQIDKDCLEEMKSILEAGGNFNQYDIRMNNDYAFLQDLDIYFKSNEVISKFQPKTGPKNTNFFICNKKVRDDYSNDFYSSVLNTVAMALKDKPILVLNGQFDFRSSVEGTNEWLRILPWNYRATWNVLEQSTLLINGVTKGISKEYDKLKHVILYNSGHLVSLDQGAASQYVVSQFLEGKKLCDGERPEEHQCRQSQCPNGCSNRGSCDNNKCNCFKGYSGDDCSIYESSINFGTIKKFEGRMFGNDYDIYKLDIGYYGINYYDIEITVKKLAFSNGQKLGKLSVFFSGGTSYVQPNHEKKFTEQFKYSSTEDKEETTLIVSDLERKENSKITIIVSNHIDTESYYELEIKTHVSGQIPDKIQLAMLLIIGGLTILMILLCLLTSIQWMYNERRKNRFRFTNFNNYQ